jgi:virginiamycin B lyase
MGDGFEHRRLLRRRALVVAISVVTLAAACTDAAGDDAPSEPPSTATVTTSPPPPPPSTEPAGGATTTTEPTTAEPSPPSPIPPDELVVESFPVPAGARPHDVAPALDRGVWYTAQRAEALGWLDPVTGETIHIFLGSGARPHGVIVDGAGDPWITDGGLNAIVRVDAASHEVTVFPLPDDRHDANLNTATFDLEGRLWFTGQEGIYGVLDPETGEMDVYDAPRGRGPYGIQTSPDGAVFYASLAGNYVGAIISGGEVVELEPPTAGQGARRVWFASLGRAWVSEWHSGQLSVYDPAGSAWATYPLPGDSAQAYAVYVDETDIVWVSDFGGNAIHRFDPATETFTTFALPHNPSNVRQILGRPGEIWGAESAADALVVIRRG